MRCDYKNTIQTVMANDAININKTSNHLSNIKLYEKKTTTYDVGIQVLALDIDANISLYLN